MGAPRVKDPAEAPINPDADEIRQTIQYLARLQASIQLSINILNSRIGAVGEQLQQVQQAIAVPLPRRDSVISTLSIDEGNTSHTSDSSGPHPE